MRDTPCARLWEIDARREGRLAAKASESFDRHLRLCAECRTQMDRDQELRSLARQLPYRGPGELVLRRLQARLLRDVAMGVRGSRAGGVRWAFAAVAGVVGMSAWLLVAMRAAPPAAMASHGSPAITAAAPGAPSQPSTAALAGAIVASSSSRWTQTREAGLERVTLDDGAIRVHVRPQAVGERFLVTLPDGEIEVRGTTFDVAVVHGTTSHVSVDEGIVDLRLRERGTTRLTAHQAWNGPPPEVPSTASRSAPVWRAPAPSAVPVVRAAPQVVDHDGDYAHAIELLRNGQYDQAASTFHALAETEPAPQNDDSSFLEAIALARAGRTDAAALVAERHLASFPSSFHRKDASILVARAASRRGDCIKARAMMAPWMSDSPDANVHTALGPCEGTPR